MIGFPCNQFGSQDPWDEREIRKFAEEEYSVSFPMTEKVCVNGPDTHPVYRYIKGFGAGDFNRDLKWNFTKYLLDHHGHVIHKFDGKVHPEAIEPEIQKLLKKRKAALGPKEEEPGTGLLP